MSAHTQYEDDILENEDDQQYLTFILGDEEYGVDILKVHEIKGWTPTTPIPNSPCFMKGVINLRGTIVPIIDLRERFSLPKMDYGATTVVIVLNIAAEVGEHIIGIVVDAVSDTHTIGLQSLRSAPDIGGVVNIEYITGLATIEDKMVIILDIDRLLSKDELNVISKAAAEK